MTESTNASQPSDSLLGRSLNQVRDNLNRASLVTEGWRDDKQILESKLVPQLTTYQLRLRDIRPSVNTLELWSRRNNPLLHTMVWQWHPIVIKQQVICLWLRLVVCITWVQTWLKIHRREIELVTFTVAGLAMTVLGIVIIINSLTQIEDFLKRVIAFLTP